MKLLNSFYTPQRNAISEGNNENFEYEEQTEKKDIWSIYLFVYLFIFFYILNYSVILKALKLINL